MARIRFIGGPFCGHTQTAPANPPEIVALPVSAGIYWMLAGGRKVPAPVTSIAVYEFDAANLAYRFVRAMKPSACGISTI